MKKILLISTLLVFLEGCGVDKSEYDKVTNRLVESENTIRILRDSIKMLSFPADQRLVKIKSLVSSGNLLAAKYEIDTLQSLFPESKEALSISQISGKIERLLAQENVEKERAKSLGFKKIKRHDTISIDYNEVKFYRFLTGDTFIFDSYDVEYRYRTADRGNKYITTVMEVTSNNKNPNLPQLAVYKISGESMIRVENFKTEFARWKNYGTYLGNYHDKDNDFAKVSTVPFKIGVEVPDEIVKGPYAIILKKENILFRVYDRFETPPVSYEGNVNYPDTLTIDDFVKSNPLFVIVKLCNL